MNLAYFVQHRFPFFFLGAENDVVVFPANERAVGRNGHNIEFIDLPKFVGLGHGGSRHAGKLAVEFEKVLQGNGGKGLGFFLDLHTITNMLGLNRLVKAIRPLAANHQTPGKFVDDDNAFFAGFWMVHHGVLLVSAIEVMCL